MRWENECNTWSEIRVIRRMLYPGSYSSNVQTISINPSELCIVYKSALSSSTFTIYLEYMFSSNREYIESFKVTFGETIAGRQGIPCGECSIWSRSGKTGPEIFTKNCWYKYCVAFFIYLCFRDFHYDNIGR